MQETYETHSIPGSGRSPGGGRGNSLEYSCLEKLEDRGAWRTTVHGVSELDTTEAPWNACTETNDKIRLNIVNYSQLGTMIGRH